ncbi:MAG: lipopolysaccharide assembly protein LapA domain-containing protein [Rhodococcus sp. (in: high G+C Gram-positive bacteria)]
MNDTTHAPKVRRRASGAISTLSLLVAAVLIVAVVIFVLQNTTRTTIDFLGWNFDLSQGVALLAAAVAGAIIAFVFSGAMKVRRKVR